MEDEVLSDRSLDEAMTESIREKLSEINTRPEETGLEEPVKADRPRDEAGKFAKAEKDATAATEAAPAPSQEGVEAQAVAPVEGEQPLVSTTGQPLDITRPPSSWKPAAKAAWTALPEQVRSEIYRRESDFLNGNKGLRENADFGSQIKGVLEPYKMLIEAEGGTPDRAVADTMRTAALFRVGTPEQKLSAIFDIDKRFNVGLSNYIQGEFNRLYALQTGQPAQNQQPAPYKDERVDQLMASMEEERRQRSQEAERVSNMAVQSFMDAKDETGGLKYPFVDNVLDDMSQRVAALRRTNPAMTHTQALEAAYDAAVWANPETRAVLVSQQQAQANQPAENLRKVEQAKRASAANVPKRGALPATGPAKSLDDTIRETARELGMFN